MLFLKQFVSVLSMLLAVSSALPTLPQGENTHESTASADSCGAPLSGTPDQSPSSTHSVSKRAFTLETTPPKEHWVTATMLLCGWAIVIEFKDHGQGLKTKVEFYGLRQIFVPEKPVSDAQRDGSVMSIFKRYLGYSKYPALAEAVKLDEVKAVERDGHKGVQAVFKFDDLSKKFPEMKSGGRDPLRMAVIVAIDGIIQRVGYRPYAFKSSKSKDGKGQ